MVAVFAIISAGPEPLEISSPSPGYRSHGGVAAISRAAISFARPGIRGETRVMGALPTADAEVALCAPSAGADHPLPHRNLA